MGGEPAADEVVFEPMTPAAKSTYGD